ncbi:unnamed protein product [Diplocarpon coronariae]
MVSSSYSIDPTRVPRPRARGSWRQEHRVYVPPARWGEALSISGGVALQGGQPRQRPPVTVDTSRRCPSTVDVAETRGSPLSADPRTGFGGARRSMSDLLGGAPSAGWRVRGSSTRSMSGTSTASEGDSGFPAETARDLPPARQHGAPISWPSPTTSTSLYCAVYGDELHLTIPRDLRQTLPATPDLVVDLPRTERADGVPGCLDRVHAHDVNNLKVGPLGDHEILLMGCDDGDVIAYYTHQLEREATRAGSTRGGVPRGAVKPFFHENVGISAWGLAIHKVSRLIATGTNFREVIVFQPGIAIGIDSNAERRCDDECDRGAFVDPLSSKTQLYTPVGTLRFGEADGGLADHYRRMNTRMRLSLGSRGHNVPSIDFLSDERGEASMVVAVDINGKLWALDLTTAETLESPPIEEPQVEHWNSDEDEIESRGWGVVCVSADAFKMVSTPQEALGVPNMTDAFKVRTDSRSQRSQSLEITSSITDVRENSPIHPPQLSAMLRPSPTTESFDDMLELESDESPSTSEAEDDALEQKRVFVLGLLKDHNSDGKYALRRPANVPDLTDRNWVAGMTEILESESWRQDTRVRKWIEETEKSVKEQERGDTTSRSDTNALQYFFELPAEVRHRFNNWHEIVAAPLLQPVPGQSPPAAGFALPESPQVMRARDGTTAIIRMNNYDIELLPPNPEALSTICRGFAQQRMRSAFVEAFLDNYDRLNMYHVIAELSLLVVASQKGRVGLFTLTRLEDCFSKKTAPILMFRLDLILPLCSHEGDYRPMRPLLGMAVAPLQGRGPCGAVQRKIWRLVLHYTDHSVLSYELKRDEGDGLVVF